MTFWKTPAFKELQRAWYQRLEEDGFRDAEKLIDTEPMLKKFSGKYAWYEKLESDDGLEAPSRKDRKDPDPTERRAKDDYFSAIAERVHDTQFPSVIDHIILSMFAEGAKMKDIHAALMRRSPPCFMDRSRCRMTIRMTIRRYEVQWGLRDYTPRQLNKREAS